MIELRQSTASQEVTLGHFLDSTDGNTEKTGLTIANTDIKLHKSGATTLASKNSGGATHISNGIYYAVLDATDTDTLGSLVIYCHVSGALAVKVVCAVLTANEWDAKYAGSSVRREVDVKRWSGTDVASPDTAGYPKVTVKSGTGTGELSVTSGVVKANLAQILGTALTETAGQIAAAFKQFFDIASPTSTMNLITAVTTTTSVTNAVNSLRGGTAQAGGSTSITLDSGASATNDLYTGAVVVIRSGTGAGQVRQITGYVGSTKVATVATAWATNPDNTSAFAILPMSDLIVTLAARLTATRAGYLDNLASAPPTANAIADQVWDEVLSGHLTSGTTGAALNGAGAAGDPWSTSLPGAYGAGTAGKIVGDNLNAKVGDVKTQTDKMNFTGTDIKATLDSETVVLTDGSLTAAKIAANAIGVTQIADNALTAAKFASGAFNAVWAVATRTLTAFGFNVTVSANNDKTGYRLSGQGVDDILDEAITEPSGVFAWSGATLRNIVGYLGAKASNKQTFNRLTKIRTLWNRAGSSTIGSATDADDGTTTTKGSDS